MSCLRRGARGRGKTLVRRRGLLSHASCHRVVLFLSLCLDLIPSHPILPSFLPSSLPLFPSTFIIPPFLHLVLDSSTHSILAAANKDNVYYRSANKELKRKLREKTQHEQRSGQELSARERECNKLRETNEQLNTQHASMRSELASLKAIIKRSFASSTGVAGRTRGSPEAAGAVSVRVDRSRLEAVDPRDLADPARRRPSSASSAGARF